LILGLKKKDLQKNDNLGIKILRSEGLEEYGFVKN